VIVKFFQTLLGLFLSWNLRASQKISRSNGVMGSIF